MLRNWKGRFVKTIQRRPASAAGARGSCEQSGRQQDRIGSRSQTQLQQIRLLPTLSLEAKFLCRADYRNQVERLESKLARSEWRHGNDQGRGLSKKKNIAKREITGNRGIALIHRVVSDMGHLWTPKGLEAGIDGFIELHDDVTSRVGARILQVQSKAGDSYFRIETDSEFTFYCGEPDVDYGLRQSHGRWGYRRLRGRVTATRCCGSGFRRLQLVYRNALLRKE